MVKEKKYYSYPEHRPSNVTPNHGPLAQTGASPYEIKVKKPYYMPMENVSIESSSDNIKGYLIQARQLLSDWNVWNASHRGQYLNCGNSKVELHIDIIISTTTACLRFKCINSDSIVPLTTVLFVN